MTATKSVLSELASATLPNQAQACVAAIIEGETPQQVGPGYSPWNILYSGAGGLVGTAGLARPSDAADILMIGAYRYWKPPLNSFPTWAGGMLANGNRSSAAGAAQITRTTYMSKNTEFGIAGFSPQDQIDFCWKYAEQRFAMLSGETLLSALGSRRTILVTAYLRPTWPGGCDDGFSKRYQANLTALRRLTASQA